MNEEEKIVLDDIYKSLILSPESVIIEYRYTESKLTLVQPQDKSKPENGIITIAKVGEDCKRFKVGDEVISIQSAQNTVTILNLKDNPYSRDNVSKEFTKNNITESNHSAKSTKRDIIDTAIVQESLIRLVKRNG